MRKIFALLLGVSLLGMVALPAIAEKGEDITVTGEMVDMRCAAKMGEAGLGPDHLKCAVSCVKSGIPAGVREESGKTYTLLTKSGDLVDLMAKTVRISGKLYKNSNGIDPEKIEYKDGETWKEFKLPETMM